MSSFNEDENASQQEFSDLPLRDEKQDLQYRKPLKTAILVITSRIRVIGQWSIEKILNNEK